MRYDKRLVYREYNDGVHDCMRRIKHLGWPVEMVTDYMT